MTAQDVEAFLYRAARLIDAGDLSGWLALCGPEMTYRVRSVLTNERAYDVGLIDDDRPALEGRIRSIEQFWHAEEPRTHLLHMITNVEILEDRGDALTVASAVTVVATRRERQAVLYGRYLDELRFVEGTLGFTRRTVTLETNLLRDGKITFIV
ncbi:MAG: aromatic-ring-hydroxylating dioxygenase subunit beta [Candidatus Lustribacter sp.]